MQELNKIAYKGLQISPSVADLIEHMSHVEAYREEFDKLGALWKTLTMLGQMTGVGSDMHSTQDQFDKLKSELLDALAIQISDMTKQNLDSLAQTVVDIVIRNLFERTADIGFLATDGDIIKFLQTPEVSKYAKEKHRMQSLFTPEKHLDFISIISGMLEEYKETLNSNNKENITSNQYNDINQIKLKGEKAIQEIRSRFQEYVSKYSVYFDIVLLSVKGRVLVTLDEKNTAEYSEEDFIKETLTTNEEYVEYLGFTSIQPKQKETLVYAYKVQNEAKTDIGVLCLCFKFEDEMQGIFKRLSTDAVLLGLLDKDGYVIASNDSNILSKGSHIQTNDKDIIYHASQKYLVSIKETNGYQGFMGLGWKGIALIPLHLAFESNKLSADELTQNIFQAVIASNEDISDSLKQIPLEANKIQSALDIAVWNGSITINSDDDTNDGTMNLAKALLWEISKTGKETKQLFEKSIQNLYEVIISATLMNAKFQSSLGIDIMDRNLYERANDCRWWALTRYFKEQIGNKDLLQDQSVLKQLDHILKGINDLYTVYTNLILFDTKGIILSVSNENEKDLVGTNMDNNFVNKVLHLSNSQSYHVSEFDETRFYNEKRSYIYGAVIKSYSNTPIGGIAIVFNSTEEFKDMLNGIVPDQRSHALFIEKKNNMVISISDNSPFLIGDILDTSFDKYIKINNGEQRSGIVIYQDTLYAVGATCSEGYREYKNETEDRYNNDIICMVLKNIGKNIDTEQNIITNNTNEISYHSSGNLRKSKDTVELACIYIGSQKFGFYKDQVLIALEFENVHPTPLASSHVAGTIFYENQSIEVLDVRDKILKVNCACNTENTKVVIIRQKEREKLIGFIVDQLADTPEIAKENIKTIDSIISNNGSISKQVVYFDNKTKPISIIDQESLFNLLRK